MWRLKIVVVLVVAAGLAFWGWKVHEANKGFTPWMSHADLEKKVDAFTNPAPGSKPQWIDAVEGRWHDGAAQFRMRYSEAPTDCYCQWYWCADRDGWTYSQHETELADRGFALLDPNTFTEPDHTQHYQAVWHLLIPKNRAPGQPQSPAALALMTESAPGAAAATMNGPSPIGVMLMPKATTLRSFTDFDETIEINPAPEGNPKVYSAELEIRSPKEGRRLVRFPYIWDLGSGIDDERVLRVPGPANGKLSDAQLRRMGKVTAGIYQIAMYVNGGRASNVATVRIDPKAKTPPVLQLVQVGANPKTKRPGVEVLVHGPTPRDTKLAYGPALYFGPIKVDGATRKRGGSSAKAVPIGSGQFCSFPLVLEGYLPAVDLSKPHKIDFKFGKYTARTLHFDPAKDDGKAWDAATAKLKMPPTLPVQMEGQVTGADGKPMPLCEVDLASMDGTAFSEVTNADGKYQFVGLAQGTYQVSFNDYLGGRGTLANTMATIPGTGSIHMDFQAK